MGIQLVVIEYLIDLYKIDEKKKNNLPAEGTKKWKTLNTRN